MGPLQHDATLAAPLTALLTHTQPQTPHAAARAASPWFGAARPQLPAALGGSQPHLPGAVAGDYGWDPLGLAKEEAAFKRYHEIELLHARWVARVYACCLCVECVAGDYGWDALGLAKDEAAFKRYHEIELLHARWVAP